MWTDEWVNQSVHKIKKLPVPQLKFKFASLTTHTKQVKLYVWICPGTTSIPVNRPNHTFYLKNSNLAMLAFKIKIEHTLTKTNYN